jgi:hypothetical protein
MLPLILLLYFGIRSSTPLNPESSFDEVSMIINGFSKERIDLLDNLICHYSRSLLVKDIFLSWSNESEY